MNGGTDYIGARDIAFALLKAEWDAACNELLGREQPVLFQGVSEDTPTSAQYWMRLSFKTSTERSKLGARRRIAYCVIFAQMFFPRQTKGSWERGVQLALRLKNLLAQPNSSATVWFRNARQNELDPDETHHRLNVVADVEYDEFD